MTNLLTVPLDIFQRIMETVLFESESTFEQHIQTCRSCRCAKIDRCLWNLKSLNLVSRGFRTRLQDCCLAQACVRIGSRTNAPENLSAVEMENIARTRSIEIEISYLRSENLLVLQHFLSIARNIRRISIDAQFPYGIDEAEYEVVVERALNPILTSDSHPRLVAFIFHLPLDGISALQSVSHRPRSVYVTTLRDCGPPRALTASLWPILSTLSIYFGYMEDQSKALLEALCTSTLPSLETLWLSYDEHIDVSLIRVFLEHTMNSIVDLTVLSRSNFKEVVRIPASASLRSVECYFWTALEILHEDVSGLQILVFRGFYFDNGPLPDTMPGLEKARHMDYVLWSLWTTGKLAAVHEVRLVHPMQTAVCNGPTNILEIAIYGYWSAVFKAQGIDFVDCNDAKILPNAWGHSLEREAPVYPF